MLAWTVENVVEPISNLSLFLSLLEQDDERGLEGQFRWRPNSSPEFFQVFTENLGRFESKGMEILVRSMLFYAKAKRQSSTGKQNQNGGVLESLQHKINEAFGGRLVGQFQEQWLGPRHLRTSGAQTSFCVSPSLLVLFDQCWGWLDYADSLFLESGNHLYSLSLVFQSHAHLNY